MALFVVLQVTAKQKSLSAALRGETPDLYALDKVPGVSHTDLYRTYLTELREQSETLESDGQLTLQDLVDMKEWVARQEHVEVIDSSRIETALLFVRAGGDLSTGKVATSDVFELLQGRAPSSKSQVTASTLSKAQKMAKWSS